MNNLEMIKPAKVQNLINKFCYTIGMLPTSYKISLTYEEQILAIGKYLEETVYPAINNNAEALAELQTLFVELKNYVENYFDNLDVQEEINKKLDEMSQSGQLQEIMADYLNANTIWTFDTVQDMKNSENLVNGSFARTYGYRNIDDGGASFYKVRTVTTEDIIDNMLIISLPNSPTLVAELQFDKGELYPEQCGAYGDGINDDITFLNACRDICISKKLQFKGNPSKIYAVSEGFTLLSGCDYDFQNATIKAIEEIQYVVRNHKTKTTTPPELREPVDNRFTKNLVIDCNSLADYGFYQDILGWSELTDNIRVLNHKLIGIYIQSGQIRLHNSKVEQLNSIYSVGVQVESSDSEYFNIITRDCTTGFKITQPNMFNEMHPVMFKTELLPNSRAFELSSYAVFIRPIVDTFQYGFYCTHSGGLCAISPLLATNPTYYNEKTMTVNPTMLYCSNQNQARITFIDCQMGNDTILNNEYPIFTNLTSWISNDLLLLNPSLAFTQYQGIPKQKIQNNSAISLANYIQEGFTETNGFLYNNGAITELRITQLILPNLNANVAVVLFNNIPTEYCPDVRKRHLYNNKGRKNL